MSRDYIPIFFAEAVEEYILYEQEQIEKSAQWVEEQKIDTSLLAIIIAEKSELLNRIYRHLQENFRAKILKGVTEEDDGNYYATNEEDI